MDQSSGRYCGGPGRTRCDQQAISSHHLTNSGREQIQSNDQWGHYQAKSIKASILRSKIDVLAALNKPESDVDRIKLQEYEHDLEQLKEQAEGQEAASEADLARHEILERGVTLFHIGIAVVAISILTKRPSFWYASGWPALWALCSWSKAFGFRLEPAENAPVAPGRRVLEKSKK